MYKKLEEALKNKDWSTVGQILQNGAPKKKFGFIDDGFQASGMFETFKDGSNIFHLLASEDIAVHIIPVILQRLNMICTREGITQSQVLDLLMVPSPTTGISAVEMLASRAHSHLPIITNLVSQYAPKHLQYMFTHDWTTVVNNYFPSEIANHVLRYVSTTLRRSLQSTQTQVDKIKAYIDEGTTSKKDGRLAISNIIEPIITQTLATLAPQLSNGQLLHDSLQYADVLSLVKEQDQAMSVLTDLEDLTFNNTIIPEHKALLEAAQLASLVVADATSPTPQEASDRKEDVIVDVPPSTHSSAAEAPPPLIDAEVNVMRPVVNEKTHTKLQAPVVLEASLPPTQEPEVAKKHRKTKEKVPIDPIKCVEEMLNILSTNAKVAGALAKLQATFGTTPTKLDMVVAFYGQELFTSLKNVSAKTISGSSKNADSDQDLLAAYVTSLDIVSLVTVNPATHCTPFQYTCRVKNDFLSKLLLDRALEVQAFGIKDAVLIATEEHYSSMVDYALSKASTPLSEMDWDHVLRTAIKYADLHTVEKYVTLYQTGAAPMVEILHPSSKVDGGDGYSIFNYLLKSLTQLYAPEYKDDTQKEASHTKATTLWTMLDKLYPTLFLPTTEEHAAVVTKSVKLLRLIWKTDTGKLADALCEALRLKLFSDTYKDVPKALAELKKEKVFRQIQDDGTSTVGTKDTHLSALSDVGSPDRQARQLKAEDDLFDGTDGTASEVDGTPTDVSLAGHTHLETTA